MNKHDSEIDENLSIEDSMAEDEAKLLDELGITGESRRQFLGQVAGAGSGVLAMQVFAEQNAFAASDGFTTSALQTELNTVAVKMKINGAEHDLQIEPRVSLLDALREFAGLTGTKKGCNQGACGACTVLIDGETRINSCLAFAVQYEGVEITTIEGLADEFGELHPLQSAFVEHDGFQCGYCTPGQICSAIGMFSEFQKGLPSAVSAKMIGEIEFSDEEIRERMSGNLCRCGAYNGIFDAVRETFGTEKAEAAKQ